MLEIMANMLFFTKTKNVLFMFYKKCFIYLKQIKNLFQITKSHYNSKKHFWEKIFHYLFSFNSKLVTIDVVNDIRNQLMNRPLDVYLSCSDD